MSKKCAACEADNRDEATFCRHCGKTMSAAPPPPADSWEKLSVRETLPSAPVPPGTVVREGLKTPGTVLHSTKAETPLCGWFVIVRGRRKGRDFRIEKDVSVMGRDGTCDYVIEDETVSRQHARVRLEGGKYIIFDLGSGNGTYLNGDKVQRAELQDGDVVKIGESLVLFKEAKPRLPLEKSDVRPIVP